MKAHQQLSLARACEQLSSMDGSVFLEQHRSLKNDCGPTISQFRTQLAQQNRERIEVSSDE